MNEDCDHCGNPVPRRHVEVTYENGDTRWFCDRQCLSDFWGERAERDLDESMDGDFDSAMKSAGLGTDEDYGYYGGEDD